MNPIELELAQRAINVEAAAIADGLGLAPEQVINSLRNGALTALCEQGIAEDAGLFRLTFFYADKRLRFIVGQDGHILGRSSAKLRRRLPAKPV
ncbi:MAG TPA: DUF6522 family protein [Steroidobacteraceae bacterium]|nr:DUF6522 family protein [Steroidobacteraceae bacterium]